MKDKKFLYIALGICLIGLIVFYFIPLILGVNEIVRCDDCFSLQKIVKLFANTSFLLAVKNTIIFTIICVLTINLFSFAIALLVWHCRNKRILVGLIIPFVTPVVSTVSAWIFIMSEISTQLLYSEYSIYIMILIYIWKYSGFHILVYYSGIKSISKSHFDAAVIDGASLNRIICHIVIPECRSFTIFNLIFSILHSFKIFRDIYILFGNYPPKNVYLIQHFIQNNYTTLGYDNVLCAGYIFAIGVLATFIPLFIKEHKEKQYYEA